MTPEEKGDLAERLVPIAGQLVVAVRDDGPHEIGSVIKGLSSVERDALLVVLAAMIDPDWPMDALLSWVKFDERGLPLADRVPRPVPHSNGAGRPRINRPSRVPADVCYPEPLLGNPPPQWDDTDVRNAHAAHMRGHRENIVVIGEREYQRRRHVKRSLAKRQGATLEPSA